MNYMQKICKEKNIIDIINSKQDLLHSKGATIDEIEKLAERTQVSFADEYVVYLKTFGIIALDGHEFTGVSNSKRMNVADVTLEYKGIYHCKLDGLYVIEDTDFDGIIMWQSCDGKVYKTIGDSEPRLAYESLSDYICAL